MRPTFASSRLTRGCTKESETDPYSTHLEPLIKTAVETQGDILELGCGDYSTLPLKAICDAQGRKYHAQASNREWASRFGNLVEIVEWATWRPSGRWGMVFLDSEESVSDRIKRLPGLSEVTNTVVMHDANIALNLHHWGECSRHYKAVKVFNRYVPWTVVMTC